MNCPLCGAAFEIVPIGTSPIAGYVVNTLQESLDQPRFSLNMQFCPKCNFTRYEEFKAAGELLNKLYAEQQSTYSLTPEIKHYINDLASSIVTKYNLQKSSRILEIGCNDGSLLQIFREKTGGDVLGFEPSQSLRESWHAKGVKVINDYFDESSSKHLISGKFDIVIIRHVLEHISDLASIMNGIYNIMGNESVLIIEVPYLPTIIGNYRIDNISYSHLNYFCTKSLAQLLSINGLGIQYAETVKTDGGSILVHCKKGIDTKVELLDSVSLEDLWNIKNRIDSQKKLIRARLQNYFPSQIVGYGAGAKGQHLIHILGLEGLFYVAVNDIEFYQNKYIPGTGIRIEKPSNHLSNKNLKAVLNLAPTHGQAIRNKLPQNLDFIELIE